MVTNGRQMRLHNIFVLKISSLKFSEIFKSLAEGILEVFEEVYQGGGGTISLLRTFPCPPTLQYIAMNPSSTGLSRFRCIGYGRIFRQRKTTLGFFSCELPRSNKIRRNFKGRDPNVALVRMQ